MSTEERPDWSKDHSKVVWNRLKIMRDAQRKVSEESDLIMQAIEAAPELDMAMQVAFGIANQPAASAQGPQGGVPGTGYKGGAPR